MSNAIPEKDSSIERGLDYIRRNRPLRAEEVCRDYLIEHPGCADHMRLLSLSLMKQDRAAEAEQSPRESVRQA